MATVNHSPLNTDGSLPPGAYWDRTIAEEIARIIGIWPLTGDHWKVINFVRKYYLEHGVGPGAYQMYKATGFRLQRLLELFPGAITWNAHCVSGVPHPGKVNSPHPGEVTLKASSRGEGEMRAERGLKEGSQKKPEVLSGIVRRKRRWDWSNGKIQWAFILVAAVISATFLSKILKPAGDGQSLPLVTMTKIEAAVGKGLIEVPLNLVRKNKLVSFEYQRLDGPVPLLAYQAPSGKIVTAIGLSELCNSKSFHVEGNEIVCNLCLTRWNLETLEPGKGECSKYPPDRLMHGTHDGRLVIREMDVRYWKPRPFPRAQEHPAV